MNKKMLLMIGMIFLAISISFGACITPTNDTEVWLNTNVDICQGDYDRVRLIANASDIYINGNNSNFYSNGTYWGINATTFDNITVSNFNFEDYSLGVRFDYSDISKITNCSVLDSSGFSIKDSNYVQIDCQGKSLDISGGIGSGISTGSSTSSHMVINDCRIIGYSGNTLSRGIYVNLSSLNTTVINSYFEDNRFAVSISASDGHNISYNTFYDNLYAVRLVDDDVTVDNNNFTDNTYGIIFRGNNEVFTNNNFTNGYRQIDAFGTSNNLLIDGNIFTNPAPTGAYLHMGSVQCLNVSGRNIFDGTDVYLIMNKIDVVFPSAMQPPPSDYNNIGKIIELDKTSDGNAYVEFYYRDSDWINADILNDISLKVWREDGGDWTQIMNTSVNTTEHYVWANITTGEFSTFAPLGELSVEPQVNTFIGQFISLIIVGIIIFSLLGFILGDEEFKILMTVIVAGMILLLVALLMNIGLI